MSYKNCEGCKREFVTGNTTLSRTIPIYIFEGSTYCKECFEYMLELDRVIERKVVKSFDKYIETELKSKLESLEIYVNNRLRSQRDMLI